MVVKTPAPEVASRNSTSSWFWRFVGGFLGFRLLSSGWLARPFVMFARLINVRPRGFSEPRSRSLRTADQIGRLECSIRGIQYELGELQDIDGIIGLDPSSGEYRSLRGGRVRQYSVSKTGPLELAAACVSRTLKEANCPPSEIHTVILASERCLKVSTYADINSLLLGMGLTQARVVGVNLSGCTNATVALRVASAIRQTEQLNTVLVVNTDTLPLEAAYRVESPGACVFSDAAISFLVGPPGEGDFDVLGIEHVAIPQIGRFELRENSFHAIRECMAGPRAAVQDLLSRAGLRPDQIACFLNANLVYGLTVAQARMCGFKTSQCYLENIPRFSHAYAGDPFINLHDACASNRVSDGDYVVLLGTAATSWGAVLLQKCKGTM